MKHSKIRKGNHVNKKQHNLDYYTIPYIIPAIKHSNKSNLNHQGISRLHKCTNSYTIAHNDWKLPGTEGPHWWCGKLVNKQIIKKCYHKGVESIRTVDEYYQWCFRPSCNKCCKKWVGRLANRGARRIENFAKKNRRKIYHFLLSPPKRQLLLSDRNLMRKVLRILREADFSVAVISHPYKIKPKQNELYYYLHFHVIGFGWKDKLKAVAEKYGWFSKCFGERKGPAFYTMHYLLSHCGIKKGTTAIRWTGKLSYRKAQ